MNSEIILAIIGLITGGALTTILNVFFENAKQKRSEVDKNIDDRILAWQKISEKNEERISQLEKKLEIYNNDIKSLERHIAILEQSILRIDPKSKLPKWPVLQNDTLGSTEEK